MGKKFHETAFDDATRVKLAIFREYIRSWLPVFLSARKSGHNERVVNIFDFFAGPGVDAKGNLGSPRIIQEELKSYCRERSELKAEAIQVKLYFNDVNEDHIKRLQTNLQSNACPADCCKVVPSSLSFQQALADRLPSMRKGGSANLVIMDQFGVKEVTSDVLNCLAQCPKTDILFFISSSYIRRFAQEPAIQNYFQMSFEELAASDYKSIHRYICNHFRSKLTRNAVYHLAPFSIMKGSNIYGVIFGSRNLLGLQKFLEACWKLDDVTGEANYDIDEDPIRGGQLSFFPADNIPKKTNAFHRELEQMLSRGTSESPVSNRDIYRFTLEKGFLPKHANSHLTELQKAGRLDVVDPESGKPIRRGAFYLNWKHYQNKNAPAIFRLKD